MKSIHPITQCLAPCLPLLAVGSLAAATFHVSPGGNDSQPGTPEAPFATLGKARDALREAGGGTAVLHGGVYQMNEPLVLTPADSGSNYLAAEGEKPVVTSAREITGWKMADANTPNVTQQAKGKIFAADVPQGWRFHFLYVDGMPATRSRSVNNDRWRDWGSAFTFGTPAPEGQTITFENKDLLRGLPSNGDVELSVILFQFGVLGAGVMTNFDPATGTGVWNSKQGCLSGGRPNETAFRFENALSLIDEPGEWAVDSAAGKVYLWPKQGQDPTKLRVTAPAANELVRLQGDDAARSYVKGVVFEGITFTCTDRLPEDQWPDSWPIRQWENPGAMILMEGVEDCAVRNCRLLNSGAYGVSLLRHALRNEVSGCEIGWTGSGGVQLFGFGGGFRDENRFNIVHRNYIHHQGTAIYWHSPNVQIFGSGDNEVTDNFLAYSAYNNVSITGLTWDQLNNPGAANTPHWQRPLWNPHAVDASTYPPEVLSILKTGKPYFTQQNYRELAIHARNNRVARNIAFECHTKLEEGGALYTWCPGKGNQFLDNVIYKSHALPGSSVLSLDDRSEYLTVAGNVIWCVGKAGCGSIGVRDHELGNSFIANIRSDDNYGDNRYCEGEPGHEKFDALYQRLKAQVDKQGGWPGKPDLPAMIEALKANPDHYELTPEQIRELKTIM